MQRACWPPGRAPECRCLRRAPPAARATTAGRSGAALAERAWPSGGLRPVSDGGTGNRPAGSCMRRTEDARAP
eukprot:8463660-Lingulodinium_polyedra.AAC.1